MTTPALVVACLLLAGLTVFQALLVAGLPLGRFAWGGQHEVLPRGLRIGSVTSIVIYALIAAILFERARVTSLVLSEGAARVATWVLVAYFGVGILLNAISRSKPERYTMTPVAAALFAATLVVALG